ncbi:MAG: cell wall-binding repeat-containing protein [Oscillospiraceae bacterium]|nr:cell wall-binding repeat-containing protein [Oscillospiraceae bacterium]
MKKWTSLILALLMIFGLLPDTVAAVNGDTISLQRTHINELYADVVSEADLVYSRPVLKADGEEIEYATSVEAAGEEMRKFMKQRQAVFTVYLQIPNVSNDELVALADEINTAAMVHTGQPTEGDYLMWQYAGWRVDIGGERKDGIAYAAYTYTVTYYTSAQQEAEVDTAVSALLEQLNVYDAADRDKIRAIYDYICANVVYDHEHVDNSDYKIQYTAYGALIDGTSVCQGYAVLLYRLALELDVDARLIAGRGGGEAHGWNIVNLGDYYYNVDSTWDAGAEEYGYFLVCDHEFTGHVRYDEYVTEEFYDEYPMPYDDGVVTTEPTCEKKGVLTYTCLECGAEEIEKIPALEHSYDEGTVTLEPTCTAAGTMTYTCGNCGDAYTEDIEALGHSYTETVVVPTCTAEGYTAHTCDNCGDSYTDNPSEKLPHDYINGKCTVCGATETVRISGENRFETSLLIADALKKELGFARFDTVVVASGDNFADALAGSYLANRTNAPILLANSKNAESVKDYIRENLAIGGTVYLLGGVNSLPAVLATGLNDYTVKRLEGADRFGTNLAILREAGAGNQEYLVCTGANFADSLSASAVRKPILLVGKKLTEDQKQFLASSGGSFTILGGENSVSRAIAEELAAYGTVERIGGSSRYETSVLIAERFFDRPTAAVLASALKFPDGLCGGPLAFTMGAPLILAAEGNETSAAEFVKQQGITRGIILGGTASVSDRTAGVIFQES